MNEELKKLIESYGYDDDDLYDTEEEFEGIYDDGPLYDTSFDDHSADAGYEDYDADEPSYDDVDSGYETHDSFEDFIASLENEEADAAAYDDIDNDVVDSYTEAVKALEEKEAKLTESLKEVQAAKAKLLKK